MIPITPIDPKRKAFLSLDSLLGLKIEPPREPRIPPRRDVVVTDLLRVEQLIISNKGIRLNSLSRAYSPFLNIVFYALGIYRLKAIFHLKRT